MITPRGNRLGSRLGGAVLHRAPAGRSDFDKLWGYRNERWSGQSGDLDLRTREGDGGRERSGRAGIDVVVPRCPVAPGVVSIEAPGGAPQSLRGIGRGAVGLTPRAARREHATKSNFDV